MEIQTHIASLGAVWMKGVKGMETVFTATGMGITAALALWASGTLWLVSERSYYKARCANLERQLVGWQRAASAGAEHRCCEECQSDCEHVPGFGYGDD